jgi:hypothetical protein
MMLLGTLASCRPLRFSLRCSLRRGTPDRCASHDMLPLKAAEYDSCSCGAKTGYPLYTNDLLPEGNPHQDRLRLRERIIAQDRAGQRSLDGEQGGQASLRGQAWHCPYASPPTMVGRGIVSSQKRRGRAQRAPAVTARR